MKDHEDKYLPRQQYQRQTFQLDDPQTEPPLPAERYEMNIITNHRVVLPSFYKKRHQGT